MGAVNLTMINVLTIFIHNNLSGTRRSHADLDWTVLKKMLEEGKAETRPGFNLEYCLRTGTAYFAWFFEGVYQYVKKEGLYKV